MVNSSKIVNSGIAVFVGLIIAKMVQEFIDAEGSAFSGIAATIIDYFVPLMLLGVLVYGVVRILM